MIKMAQKSAVVLHPRPQLYKYSFILRISAVVLEREAERKCAIVKLNG